MIQSLSRGLPLNSVALESVPLLSVQISCPWYTKVEHHIILKTVPCCSMECLQWLNPNKEGLGTMGMIPQRPVRAYEGLFVFVGHDKNS